MANLKSKPTHPVYQTEFRFIPNIDSLENDALNELGYYKGAACPHGHTIRDTNHHWCYYCVMKIKSNVCGFDLNYLDANYKHSYHKLWHQVQIGHPEDCWPIKDKNKRTPSRICLPSYRTGVVTDKKDNVNVHKAIYQCAWGDIGSMVVTRTCKNLNCGNPLHMVSSWNRLYPPSAVNPFCIEFDAQKLMQYANLSKRIDARLLIEQHYKQTITHPLDAPGPPYYDEG
jgi:hypothetical protein